MYKHDQMIRRAQAAFAARGLREWQIAEMPKWAKSVPPRRLRRLVRRVFGVRC